MHIGCAQLIRLPFQLIGFVLSLPFQIIKLAIRLLPLAIKYAPLALLLVSNKDKSNLDRLENIVEEINSDGIKCAMRKCSVTSTLTCYQIEFIETIDNPLELANHIERLLNEQEEACIVFTEHNKEGYSRENLYSIWRYMIKEGIKVGCNKNLGLSYPDSKESKT